MIIAWAKRLRLTQLFVSIYIAPDLPALIMSNPDFRKACARTRQQQRCREQPRQQFHASYPNRCDAQLR